MCNRWVMRGAEPIVNEPRVISNMHHVHKNASLRENEGRTRLAVRFGSVDGLAYPRATKAVLKAVTAATV